MNTIGTTKTTSIENEYSKRPNQPNNSTPSLFLTKSVESLNLQSPVILQPSRSPATADEFKNQKYCNERVCSLTSSQPHNVRTLSLSELLKHDLYPDINFLLSEANPHLRLNYVAHSNLYKEQTETTRIVISFNLKGVPSGAVLYSQCTYLKEEKLYLIDAISVKKSYRGKGVGSILLKKIEENILHSYSITKTDTPIFTRAEILPSNFSSIRLFEKNGYNLDIKKSSEYNYYEKKITVPNN
ncbi:GNAT family N-acetyltransferase [uncultured Endozoicomonas sp.]|uniref:GNAT family N-acetyltransferase n=1 Tax=uncultured Endozoicomonas sp. TaxID=432652 RepID=UPI0026277B97|nr:GNAT family N-acetyltransferase [uncultured Endozoicomonas sp.]